MRRKTGFTRVAVGFGAFSLCILGISPAPAAEPVMRIAQTWTYDVPEDVYIESAITPGSLILNPEHRSAFQIFELTRGRTLIRVLDLDTLETRAESISDLPFSDSRGYKLTQYMHGLDPDTNTLFLPYQNRGAADGVRFRTGFFEGIAVISGETGAVTATFPRTAAADPTHLVEVSETPPTDASDVAACTSAACQPQTFGIGPTIAAMEFIPAFVSGSKPKILMLWVEPAPPTLEGNVFVNWATQWDAATGKQDFSYRIQSCTTEPPGGGASRYPLSIFQARLGAGIYVGCNAQGGTGQVVRIRLDSTGQPSGEDSFPGPTGVSDIFADRTTDRILLRVQTFNGESFWVFNGSASTYAGIVGANLGDNATRVGIDERNGRMYIMAPETSFENQVQPDALLTSDFRRSPAAQVTLHPQVFVKNTDLALVIDTHHPSGTRRIFAHPADTDTYVIIEDPTPPTFDEPLTDQDRFTVDVEEEEGETDVNYSGTGHAFGLRALFAGGIQGAVPIVIDASGATVRGQFAALKSPCQTPDRELRLGSVPFATLGNTLTSAESAAASTEASTIPDLREPSGRCEPHPDVRDAKVPSEAQALLDADADGDGQTNEHEIGHEVEQIEQADSDADGQTNAQEIEQVTQLAVGDDDADGQSNVDETLGTDWPFFASQCSGDAEDKDVTTLRPLDRNPVPHAGPNGFPTTGTAADQALADAGSTDAPATGTPADQALAEAARGQIPTTGTPGDAIARAPRQTGVTLEDNRAEVRCAQSEERVNASAVAGALDVDGLPPGVETLTVGSVGSSTRLYRDPARGLVAETIAFTRDISIGDRISIDVAYSRAEAWAGGRPGTAGTTLERRICGVSVPEIGGRYDVIPIDTPVGEVPPDPDPVHVGDPVYDLTKDIENPQDGSQGVSVPLGDVDPLSNSADDQNIDGAVSACAEAPVSQANGTALGSRPFLEVLNRVLGARGRATIPEPDRELRQGSPGGYLASIQKDRYQQVGARAVSNDGSTQVPALEIQLYNDDPQLGRGRQLFQFAGVDASVTYGIYLLNPEYETPIDTPDDGLPPFDVTDDLPPLTGGPTLPPVGGYPPPSTTPPSGVFAPVTYLYRGVTFLARSWQDAALAAGVLILLAAPLILLGRRRALRTLA